MLPFRNQPGRRYKEHAMFGRAYLSLLVTLVCLTFAIMDATAEQPSFCSEQAVPDASSAVAYKLRGNGERCEGLISTPVAARALSVVSLALAATASPANPPGLSWCGIPGSIAEVHIRSLERKPTYALDTVASTSNYAWPSDVLDRLRVPLDQLGILVSATVEVSEQSRTVYFPVWFDSQQALPVYRIVIRTGPRIMRDFTLRLGSTDRCSATGNSCPIYEFPATETKAIGAQLLESRFELISVPEGVYRAYISATYLNKKKTTSQPFYIAHKVSCSNQQPIQTMIPTQP